MRFLLLTIALSIAALHSVSGKGKEAKPRIVILTDVAPGDVQSMIRLLAHADLFEIEGLILTAGFNSCERDYPVEWKDSLLTVIDAYEKDLPNLMKRSGQNGFRAPAKENRLQKIGYWPSADYLRSRVRIGSLRSGVAMLGDANDSPGSRLIMELAQEKDDRPIYVAAWGSANTVAQALWRAEQDGNGELLVRMLGKLRVYAITDQDVECRYRGRYDLNLSSHQWMRERFGEALFFIWDETSWLSHCMAGPSYWDAYTAQRPSGRMLSEIQIRRGRRFAFLHIHHAQRTERSREPDRRRLERTVRLRYGRRRQDDLLRQCGRPCESRFREIRTPFLSCRLS